MLRRRSEGRGNALEEKRQAELELREVENETFRNRISFVRCFFSRLASQTRN